MSTVQPLRRLTPAPQDARPYDMLVRPDGMVHRTLFTDPAIFEQEMGKIFGGTWVFLLHQSELPDPNDFKCVNIGRRPVIVTRTDQGEIRALMNRCSHRFTTGTSPVARRTRWTRWINSNRAFIPNRSSPPWPKKPHPTCGRRA